MDEIHFLYNEIEDKVNKDIEKILFQIKNPLAGKRAGVIRRLTNELIFARAKELATEREKREHKQRARLERERQALVAQGLVQTTEFRASIAEVEAPAVENMRAQVAEHPEEQMQRVVMLNLVVDSETNEVLAKAEVDDAYNVFEPDISDADVRLLKQAENDIKDEPGVLETRRALIKQLHKSAKVAKTEFYEDDYLKFKYYLVRDLLSYNVVEPLIHDAAVEKIICNGPGEFIEVIREGRKLKSTLVFRGKDDLHAFLLFIAEKTFQRLSLEEPVLDAVFRGFRIQGILGTDVVPTKFIMTRV